MGRTCHKQVTIQWNGQRREVDEEIAPLILALWELGIETVTSCQEKKPGVAFIWFKTPDDAKKFLDIVAVFPDEDDDRPLWATLYGRITLYGKMFAPKSKAATGFPASVPWRQVYACLSQPLIV